MREIVTSVIAGLAGLGLKEDRLREVASAISFSVAAVVDGSAYVDFEDDHLVPVLAFAEGRMRDKLLAPEEGGSSRHEFVFGLVDEILPYSAEVEGSETDAARSRKPRSRAARKAKRRTKRPTKRG